MRTRANRDRFVAILLTGLVFAGLWLGGRRAYLERSPIAVRMLSMEEGIAIRPRLTAPQADETPLMHSESVQRRTISLSRPVRTATQVTRRMTAGSPRLQVSKESRANGGVAARSRRPDPMIERDYVGPQGSTLNVRVDEHQVAQEGRDDRISVRTPAIRTRRVEQQTVSAHTQPSPQAPPVAIDEIVEWMRLSPAELPPGIRRHVEYQPGNLTSSAQLEHDGELWEVFLMVRVSLRELHIVVVRGDDTWYLIDRSFERQGRSFRTGYARRDGVTITGVVSEEQPAASRQAEEFYTVFLGWWDQQRLKL